jgi:hypothetical protein
MGFNETRNFATPIAVKEYSMTPDQVQSMIQELMGSYGWWLIATAILFFFKGAVENFVSGITFYYGNDYNVDDIVYIGGNKKARIVRQTFTKTVFYLIENNRRMVVSNRQLDGLRCETVLPIEKE